MPRVSKTLRTLLPTILLAWALSALVGCGTQGTPSAESVTGAQDAAEAEDAAPTDDATTVEGDAPTGEAEAPDRSKLEALLDEEVLEEADGAESRAVDETDANGEEWSLPDEIVIDETLEDPGADDATKGRSMPSLSNASDQRALNVFLSNFTEVGMGLTNRNGYVFNRYRASTQEYANLAFWHYYQNGGNVEFGNWKLGNARVKSTKLDAATDYLTDRVVKSWANLNNTDGWYRYKKGYVYTQVTNGKWMCGPAVAIYARDNGDGYLRVGFDGYYYDSGQTGYSVGDGSQYGMSESQLNRMLGVRGPNGYGTAIVDYWWGNGKWNFRLVSLTVFID